MDPGGDGSGPPDGWEYTRPREHWQPAPLPPVWAGTDDPWYGAPLVGADRTWVPAAHWLPILTSWLGPVVVLLTVGERNARVREHAKASLNFEITFWLLMFVSALLCFVGVGWFTTPALLLAGLVLRIVATRRASRGRFVRYPFVLRLVR